MRPARLPSARSRRSFALGGYSTRSYKGRMTEQLARFDLRVEPADGEAVWVSGATFARREALKRQGGSWSRDRQAWRLPSAEALARLAAALDAEPAPLATGLAEEAAPAPGFGGGWGTKHYHGHRERLRQRFTRLRRGRSPTTSCSSCSSSSPSTAATPSRSPRS